MIQLLLGKRLILINNKKILCVVTARAGSKGIPKKNIRPLLGKPLFMWSVLAGLESKYVDKTVVSSNDQEAYEIFHQFNQSNNELYTRSNKLKWIQRPDELSGDLSRNEEALIHAIHWKRDVFKEEYDIIINLQPTSPCRLSGMLDRSIEAYIEGGYDSLLTATKDTPFIWQKIDGKWIYTVDKNDCCDRKMRQEFQESEFIWHDCGNIYIVDTKILLDKKCRIGYNPCIFEIEGINNIQIDDEFDFELIEKMLKMKKLERPI
jgi:CMP-N,N'-diacetyllegionaminic acid synthase